jgi:amino acid adenylation domain-containing protein
MQAHVEGQPQRFSQFEEPQVEHSIAARFEEQVRLYPERIAIKNDTAELTYTQLNGLANRIAHAILDAQPLQGSQIGLLFSQQLPTVAASFGALKAGRTYLALDPSYPRARQEFMLQDAGVGIVLTDATLLQQAHDLAAGRIVIDVGTLESIGSGTNPGLSIAPDAFAYIIYTSGTTGQPKGVIENQRNVLHFTMNNTNMWRIGPDDRISLLVPYWFSGSATPTFAALLNGAALVALDIKKHGIARLATWLVEEDITVFHCSTSLFRQFARALSDDDVLHNVRLVFVGAEPLFSTDVDQYRRHFADHCRLANGLGASEVKTLSMFQVDKSTLIPERLVPVGYPMPGFEVLVLDENMQAVKTGSVGEIVARSRYLSPGYWGRPDLTERAFRTDSAGAGTRLYHTGDLGRLDTDGCLHHIGRKDLQVKIRGYRIELGEVTAALLELPELVEATVVMRELDAAGPRLVAYVVAHAQPAPTVTAMRSALEKSLPGYMVPAAFVVLTSLPRNANGKVDVAALPEPSRSRPELGTAYVAPRTPLEVRLAQVWSEVLCVDEPGVLDDFLALGGDSLLAVQLIARVGEVVERDLPVDELLRAPTIAEQALVLLRLEIAATPGGELAQLLDELDASDE